MTTDEQQEYLTWLCDNARPIMRTFGLSKCACISSARVLYLCLTRMGIEAQPVPCKYGCLWRERELAHVIGCTPEELQNHKAMPSPWQPVTGWNGHLVIVALDHLLDPSVDETLRLFGLPDYPSVAQFPLGGRRLDNGGKLVVQFQIEGDYPMLETQYVAVNDQAWRSSVAWNDVDLNFIAGMINGRWFHR